MILAAVAMMSVACCKNCDKKAEEGACCADSAKVECCCGEAHECCAEHKCCADSAAACCEHACCEAAAEVAEEVAE